MQYLTDIDRWQLRLIVDGAFQRHSDPGNSGDDGHRCDRNAEPSALGDAFTASMRSSKLVSMSGC
ncbi:hypothetical protein CK228_31050 [Mesorhizobium sp. WSM4312]|nr:hypothetical protein CK228_31050 [Mesorhizobium sp. WSM4312]